MQSDDDADTPQEMLTVGHTGLEHHTNKRPQAANLSIPTPPLPQPPTPPTGCIPSQPILELTPDGTSCGK